MISEELVDMLACPKCKEGVKLDVGYLVCGVCGLKYRIEDDIPIMLIEEAVDGKEG